MQIQKKNNNVNANAIENTNATTNEQQKNQEEHKYDAGAGRDENVKGSESLIKDNRKNDDEKEAQPESDPERDHRIAFAYQVRFNGSNCDVQYYIYISGPSSSLTSDLLIFQVLH